MMKPLSNSPGLWRNLAVFLFVLLVIAGVERAFYGFIMSRYPATMVFQVSELAALLVEYHQANGEWPPPGLLNSQWYAYERSDIGRDGSRLDHYKSDIADELGWYLPQRAMFHLSPEGGVRVFLED